MRVWFMLATALLTIDPSEMEMIQAICSPGRPLAAICHAKPGLAISFDDYHRFVLENNSLQNLAQPLANQLRNFRPITTVQLQCVSGDVVHGVTAPAAAEMDLDFALQPGRRLAANQAAQFP